MDGVILIYSYRNCNFFTFATFHYSLLLPQCASLARLLTMGAIFVWRNHSAGSSANTVSCVLIQVVPLGKHERV